MPTFICTIYEDRPEACRSYPQLGSYRPESCTYWFDEHGVRHGECSEECMAACCALPRRNGEPGEIGLPEAAGGRSCKYLSFAESREETTDKVASAHICEVFRESVRDLLG